MTSNEMNLKKIKNKKLIPCPSRYSNGVDRPPLSTYIKKKKKKLYDNNFL